MILYQPSMAAGVGYRGKQSCNADLLCTDHRIFFHDAIANI
jgi:hypothetical protein